MDYLWSPWRYRYLARADQNEGCVFCEKSALETARDAESLVLFRGERNFVLLNLYPYTTGHTMVVPYAHIAGPDKADRETLHEMIDLAQQVQSALAEVYTPQGYNLGMNIGQCAGAGVADHIHLHVLPRWIGDSNFMTVIGETRVEPESLATTYEKMRPFFTSSKR